MSVEEKNNGIKSQEKIYVKYDKGDKDGNRWIYETPYYIKWDIKTVSWFQNNSGKKGVGMPVLRNKDFYFKTGFCWSDVHTTYLKCRLKRKTVHDVKSMSLTSINEYISDKYLVCIINSNFISKFQQDFINNTASFQINDARRLPIIVPNKKLSKQFTDIFDNAANIKRDFLDEKISFDEQETKLLKIENENNFLVEKVYRI